MPSASHTRISIWGMIKVYVARLEVTSVDRVKFASPFLLSKAKSKSVLSDLTKLRHDRGMGQVGILGLDTTKVFLDK